MKFLNIIFIQMIQYLMKLSFSLQFFLDFCKKKRHNFFLDDILQFSPSQISSFLCLPVFLDSVIKKKKKFQECE